MRQLPTEGSALGRAGIVRLCLAVFFGHLSKPVSCYNAEARGSSTLMRLGARTPLLNEMKMSHNS